MSRLDSQLGSVAASNRRLSVFLRSSFSYLSTPLVTLGAIVAFILNAFPNVDDFKPLAMAYSAILNFSFCALLAILLGWMAAVNLWVSYDERVRKGKIEQAKGSTENVHQASPPPPISNSLTGRFCEILYFVFALLSVMFVTFGLVLLVPVILALKELHFYVANL